VCCGFVLLSVLFSGLCCLDFSCCVCCGWFVMVVWVFCVVYLMLFACCVVCFRLFVGFVCRLWDLWFVIMDCARLLCFVMDGYNSVAVMLCYLLVWFLLLFACVFDYASGGLLCLGFIVCFCLCWVYGYWCCMFCLLA